LTTLLFRRRAQDLFDLIYSIFFTKDCPISRAEVIRTFLKKSIFDAEARQARTQLLALPLQAFQSLWGGLVAPKASRFTFETVVLRFGVLLDELFGVLEPEPARVVSRTARPLARGFSYGGSFVPSARQIIIEAGRARHMIEAEYH